jgi:queuine tRNA-ribosyltransferase
MTGRFSFRLLATDAGARLGEVVTPRGVVRTPAFMPVGTAATVKAVYPDQLKAAGADIVLANTYHRCCGRAPSALPGSVACTPSCAGTGRS